jgi:hypothetical protein
MKAEKPEEHPIQEDKDVTPQVDIITIPIPVCLLLGHK